MDADVDNFKIWHAVLGGLALYFFRGFNFTPLGEFVSMIAELITGLGLFVFIIFFGIVVGNTVARVGRHWFFGIALSVVFYGILHIVTGAGAYASVVLFKILPWSSISPMDYFQAWFEYFYAGRFRAADFSFFGRYVKELDNLADIGDVISLIITIIINFIPDYVMFKVSQLLSGSAAVVNYFVEVTYWMIPTTIFIIIGYKGSQGTSEKSQHA
jgi:hypothetical protein